MTNSGVLKALVAARKDIGAAKKGSVNPHFRSKYADLGAVMEAVKEPLEAHGLAFVQDIENNCVVTLLIHESGESLKLAPFPLVVTQNTPQAMGSALTYARRYSLQTALGVPAEDDDGNAASRPAGVVINPVREASKGIEVDESKAQDIAAALKDFYEQFTNLGSDSDADYKAWEIIEPMDSDMKMRVWELLAKDSKVRAWLKKIGDEHRQAA
jgi:hypothetical protein